MRRRRLPPTDLEKKSDRRLSASGTRNSHQWRANSGYRGRLSPRRASEPDHDPPTWAGSSRPERARYGRCAVLFEDHVPSTAGRRFEMESGMPTLMMSASTHLRCVAQNDVDVSSLRATMALPTNVSESWKTSSRSALVSRSVERDYIARYRLCMPRSLCEWDSWTAMKARGTVTLKNGVLEPTRQGD